MPGKLILKFGDSILGEYPLDKETLTIGRKPNNDITVENLAVSGHHSRVITILQDSFLEDLNSTNGTYVNGKLIQKHALQHGDVVKIGKHELQYVNEETAMSDDDMEKTMIIRPSALSAAAQQKATDDGMANAQAMQSGGEAKPAGLKLMSGPNAGRSMELKKALTSLGKPGVQVASISKRPDGYILSHVEGDSTPIVNDEDVGASPYTLQEGDVIQLAGIKIQFQYN
jgi:pSer/pThr/pTyr-binding forkhead associated (FHA) protein